MPGEPCGGGCCRMISYEEARREGRSRLRCKNKAIRGRAWTVRSLPFSDVPRVVILLSEVLVDATSSTPVSPLMDGHSTAGTSMIDRPTDAMLTLTLPDGSER